MAKLLPPIVEGTIPAFYSNNGMVNITIPFSMNRAVSKAEVGGIAVKIKTLQSSSTLINIPPETENYSLGNECFVTFNISNANIENIFRAKQFYKFQIAYVDKVDGSIGYYSSVSIGKCTSKPEIYIDGLSSGIVNYHSHSYTGVYRNNDYTENVYSYRFDLSNQNGEIEFTTGDLIHNALNDDDLSETVDICEISQSLDEGTFYLQYSIITTNGLNLQTEKYILKKSFNIDMDVQQPILTAVADNDNGRISLSFTSGITSPQDIDANFVLYRSDEDSNFLNWEECYYFSLNGSYIQKNNFWEDYTVEHKKQYKYAIAQFNDNGLYSEKVEANIINGKSQPVSIDFEDIYLYDSTKRLLKIKYNPKVASFKNNIMETKIETIGKQHPFILRNGVVSYKEFPISGLITHLMDTNINNNLYRWQTEAVFYDPQNRAPEKLDIDKVYVKQNNTYVLFTKELYAQANVYKNCYIQQPEIDTLSTDLTSDNIYKERQFKLDTLAWLTNGEPKLFRSPTEGNYIVRLLNVSLTPLDQLGRMLHSFNCTAYEIAESTYENMHSFGILGANDIEVKTSLQWKTLNLSNFNYVNYVEKNILPITATTIRFYDMIPGQQIELKFSNGHSQKIVIGNTGMYRLENAQYSIVEVILHQNTIKKYQGYMTYSFKQRINNDFKTFNEIEMINVPVKQFIGQHDIIEDLLKINGIVNTKVSLVSIPRIKFYQRPIIVLLKKNNNYYQHNGINETKVELNTLNEYNLYVIVSDEKENEKIVRKVIDFVEYKNNNFISLRDNNISLEDFENSIFNIYIGNSKISLKNKYEYIFKSDNLSSYMADGELQLKIGAGIIAEMSYIMKSQTYILESNETYNIENKKLIYENDLIQLDKIYQREPAQVYDNDGNQININEWPELNKEDKGWEASVIQWDTYINNQKKYIDIHYNDYITTLESERYRFQIVEGTLEEG